MKINVALPRIRCDRPYSVEEDIAIARAAEAAGLHAISVNDHPFPSYRLNALVIMHPTLSSRLPSWRGRRPH